MNIFLQLAGLIISIPARIKGMKFGKESFIGPGYDWLFVRLKGVTLGNNVLIGKNAWLQTNVWKGQEGKIIINDNTQIGRYVIISASKKIQIGQNCMISYNVSLLDHDHDLNGMKVPLIKSSLGKSQSIKIGDNSFIGAHSFILKGVQLGSNCVVGANSVVTKSFPAFSRIAGNPARLIKK